LALSRADHRWLADGLDLFPLSDARPIVERGESKKERHVPEHPLALLELAGIADDLAVPERLYVGGAWESHDSLSVSIGSRLVDPRSSRVAGHAMHCAPPGFAFFPHEDRFHADEERSAPVFEKWLSDTPETYAHIDGQDPYGCNVARQRRGPTPETAAVMKVAQADTFGRTWRDSGGNIVFEAQAWGAARGRSQHKTERSGTRVDVRGRDLRTYLAEIGRHLILHIRVRKHLDNNEWGEKAYRQLVLTCIVRGEGSIEPIWSVPKRFADALAKLAPYERGEFNRRYEMIGEMAPPRPLGWPRQRARTSS
jgi:hypothetical protein